MLIRVIFGASLVAQLVKNIPAVQETWVQYWVGKIPWRRERLPTQLFWPGEFHGLYSSWGRKESNTTEQLSLSFTMLVKRQKKKTKKGLSKLECLYAIYFSLDMFWFTKHDIACISHRIIWGLVWWTNCSLCVWEIPVTTGLLSAITVGLKMASLPIFLIILLCSNSCRLKQIIFVSLLVASLFAYVLLLMVSFLSRILSHNIYCI